MRKINSLIIAVAILLTSVASYYAFQTYDIKPATTPDIAIVRNVINNSGNDLVNGDVVIWDESVTTSTGNAVTTTTTIGNSRVAGVWIVRTGTKTVDGDTGDIQAYGYCPSVKVRSTSIVAGDLLISTNTAKFCGEYITFVDSNTAVPIYRSFGFSLETVASTSTKTTTKAMINCLGN